jgi:hypothetical protein
VGATRARIRPALGHDVAIDIEPAPVLANETTALVLPYGRGIADTRSGDELHFGGIIAGKTRGDNPQSQPFLLSVEWDGAGSGTRMPRREQIWLIAQDEGAVAGSHQRRRVGWHGAGVQRSTALPIRAGGTARARILGRRIHRTQASTDPSLPNRTYRICRAFSWAIVAPAEPRPCASCLTQRRRDELR